MQLKELLTAITPTEKIRIDGETLNRYCNWYRNDIQTRFGITCKYERILEFMARWMWYFQGNEEKPNRREPPKRGLFLFGKPGVGKTTLMKVLWQYFNQYPAFLKVEDMAKDFSSGGAVEVLSNLDTYSGFPVIIDDLGNERDCRYYGDRFPMADMIRFRYNEFQKGNLTLFTSNLETGSAITEAYGYPITSRLMEMCEFVRIDGIDRRAKR